MTEFVDGGARLHVAVHTDADRTTVTLTGELDSFSGPLLTQFLDTAMAGNVKHLQVQMAQLGFVDVAGVRVLLHAYQRGADRGVALTLHDPVPHVIWLLGTTGAAVLLGDSTAPADATMVDLGNLPPPVTAGEPKDGTHVSLAGTYDDRDRRADERDRRADERDRRADERAEQADDRDRLSQERDRLLGERQERVGAHQRWEDIREDLADARERDLDRREQEH